MESFIPNLVIGAEALGDEFLIRVGKDCNSITVLHDGHLGVDAISILLEMSSACVSILDIRKVDSSFLEGLTACSVVVYACIQDDLGLPFIHSAYKWGLKVVPVFYAKPRSYLWRNSLAKSTLLEELAKQRDAGFLKADYGIRDFINLIQAFERTKHLTGCIVELGCFRGSSAGALLSYIASYAKSETEFSVDLFYLDVFSGFNYPESLSSSDAVWHGTHSTEGLIPVRQRLQAYALDTPGMSVHVLESNVISDPIPREILEHKIRLLNVDVDLYEAVSSALLRYAEHVVIGGIIICEDAGHTPLLIGAFKAVEEFMSSELGSSFCRFDLPSGQTMLVRIANDACSTGEECNYFDKA